MDNISIDIETYSSVNLQKAGVYKYAESDDFEILLFAYSVDGSDVKVIDLAKGEEIPVEILDALTDEEISKWAFNAQFERVCLSRFLRDKGISLDPFYDNHEISTSKAMFLNPISWKCTMIWSATLGLPLSLEGVGAVLGLDKQKLSEGKNLIKYFCVPCTPTKVNGGRTRNRHFHDEEKWEQFKSYNKRDVEVEMGIQAKLSNFPISEDIWDEFYLDQQINDRGIAIDPVLVESAIMIDEKVKTRIMNHLIYGANRTGRFAGKLVQLQNLPQNHLPDLSEARSLVRAGNVDALEMLYEDIPDTLLELLLYHRIIINLS